MGKQGKLDIALMRKLAMTLKQEESKEDELTENDLMNMLLQPLTEEHIYRALKTMSIILAILNEDPMVSLKWMKENRLSLLSIPGFKSKAYENIEILCNEDNKAVTSENEINMLELVAEKIEVLKGM